MGICSYLTVASSIVASSDKQNAGDFHSEALRPTSPTPYTMRGGAYELAGDRERAIADLEKALEIDPNLPTVREVLQRLKSK
jgi:Flp pilus assembly protein TadD